MKDGRGGDGESEVGRGGSGGRGDLGDGETRKRGDRVAGRWSD